MNFIPNLIVIKENQGLVKQTTSDISLVIAHQFDPIYKEIFDKEADVLQSKGTYVLFSMLKSSEQTKFIEALSHEDVVESIEGKFHSTTIDTNTWPLAIGETSTNVVLSIVQELVQSDKCFSFISGSKPGRLLLFKIINHYLLGIGIIKHDISIRVPVFTLPNEKENDGIVMGLKRFVIELQYKNHVRSLNLRPAVLPKRPSTERFGVPSFKYLIANYFIELRRRLHVSFKSTLMLNQIFSMIKAWWADSIAFESHVNLPNFANFKKIVKNYNLMQVALTSNYDINYDFLDPITQKKYSIAIGVNDKSKTFKAFSLFQILPQTIIDAINDLAHVIDNPPDTYKTLWVNELPTYFRHVSIYNYTSNELLAREIKKSHYTPDFFIHSVTALSSAQSKDFSLYLKEYYSIESLEASHTRLVSRLKGDINLANMHKKFEKFYELSYDTSAIKAYEKTNADVVPKELRVPLAMGVSQYISFIGSAPDSTTINKDKFNFSDKDGVENTLISKDSAELSDFVEALFAQKMFFIYEYISDINFKTYPINSIDLTKSRMDEDGISETIDIDFLFSTISSLGFSGSSVLTKTEDTFKEVLNTPYTFVLEDVKLSNAYYLDKSIKYSLKYFEYITSLEIKQENDISINALLNYIFGVNMNSMTWINESYRKDFADAIELLKTTYNNVDISNNSKYMIEQIITEIYSTLSSDPIIKNMLINLSLSSLPFNGNIFRTKEYIKFDRVYEVATFNFEQVTSALFAFYFGVDAEMIRELYGYIPATAKRAAIVRDYQDFAVKFVKEQTV